jgi:hypothetical protein
VAADYIILVTDKQLNVIGDPITSWTQIDVTLKFNEPSSGLFTAPGYDWIRSQLIPGCRIVVVRDGEVLIAGPMEKSLWERSDDGDNAGAGVVTVNFADYLSLIVARQTYPDGTLAPAAQVLDNWTFTGNAELALRELVDENAGPSALAARQIPQLVLGPVAGVGSSVTAQADRMEPLGDVLRRVAVAGGGLGFRAQQVGTQVEFQVYQPLDLANQVIFGFGAGSLKYIAYEATAPTVNAAIVGGQGEGSDRLLIERGNVASQDAWDRRETLVSRPGNDPVADLNADGDDALADGVETVRVPMSTADTPFQRYGDYSIGSLVSVESAPGSMISDVVVSVHFQVYPTAGEVVATTVGSQAEQVDPMWIQRMRAMDRRVSYLERNVVPAAV